MGAAERNPICCQIRIDGLAAALPFLSVISLGYYDGPTEGFGECFLCGRAYRFDLLAWDDQQNCRIFGIWKVSQSLTEIGSHLGSAVPEPSKVALISELSASKNIYLKESLYGDLTFITVAPEGIFGISSVWKSVKKCPEFSTYEELLAQVLSLE